MHSAISRDSTFALRLDVKAALTFLIEAHVVGADAQPVLDSTQPFATTRWPLSKNETSPDTATVNGADNVTEVAESTLAIFV